MAKLRNRLTGNVFTTKYPVAAYFGSSNRTADGKPIFEIVKPKKRAKASKSILKMRRRNARKAQKNARAAAKVTRVKRNPSPPPIKKNRPITNDDLWASVRGLGMFSKSVDQLIALYEQHKGKEMFASKVIAEAAKQVAITKGAKFVRK